MCGIFIGEAFGALIASGILDGVFGYTAWRWLFSVEGALTILVATLAFCSFCRIFLRQSLFFLVDFLRGAQASKAKNEGSTQILEATHRPPRVLQLPHMERVHSYSVRLKSLGYGSLHCILLFCWFPFYVFPNHRFDDLAFFEAGTTLLLCVPPPWVFAAAITLWVCRHSDRTGEQCVHVVSGPSQSGLFDFCYPCLQ